MRRKLSLLLLAALLLGGCGTRAETVATEAPDPMEAVLRLFYPCSLVRSTDGQWYTLDAAAGGTGSPLETALAGSGTVVNPLAPLASAVPEALICNDNPFVRVTPLARQIEAGETMTLPLRVEQKERELGDNPLDGLRGFQLEMEIDGQWYVVDGAGAPYPDGGLRLPRLSTGCDYDLPIRLETEAAGEAGQGFTTAPLVPPAGRYRWVMLKRLAPDAAVTGLAEFAAAHPELCDAAGGLCFFVTIDFEIVAAT